MIKSKNFAALAPIITLLVIGLGAWMWMLDPERSAKWALTIGFLPVAWLGIFILQRVKACQNLLEGSQQSVMSGISFAGLILGGSLGLIIAQHYHIIENSSSDRLVAVLIGTYMIIIGNALPKKLAPLKENTERFSQRQSFKRFAGWMLVLSGLGYALAWIALPESLADMLATPLMIAPILAILARMTFLKAIRT